MNLNVTVFSQTDEIDCIRIEANVDLQPAEDPTFDGGMPSYPGCDESIDICSFNAFNDETSASISGYVLTENDKEKIWEQAAELYDYQTRDEE